MARVRLYYWGVWTWTRKLYVLLTIKVVQASSVCQYTDFQLEIPMYRGGQLAVIRCTIPAPVLGQRPAGIAKSSIVSFVKLPTVWDLSPVTSQLNPSLHPHCSRSNSLARHHFTNPIQLNVYVCCVCGCGCVRSWFCRLDIVQLSRLLLEAHCLKVCV